MNKTILYMYGGVVVVGLMISAPIYAMGGQGMGTGAGSGGQGMIDKNNNGIPDGMEDFDGDDISNREDDDFDKSYINMKDTDEDGVANREDDDYELVGNGAGRLETSENNQVFESASENKSIQEQELKQALKEIEERKIVEKQKLESAQTQKRIMNQKKNAEIVDKIHIMKQSREQLQQEIADDVVQLQKQSAFGRFFKGSDHDVVEHAEEQINKYEVRIEELKALSKSTSVVENKNLIEEQIMQMEEMSVKMQKLIKENSESFNLFGWAVNLFN